MRALGWADWRAGAQCSTPGIASRKGAIGASNCCAVVVHHLIAALHGTHGRFDDGAAGVAKSLARVSGTAARRPRRRRAVSLTLPLASVMIQCRVSSRAGDLALVANGDGVGEHESLVARIGLFLDIGGFDVDADLQARWVRRVSSICDYLQAHGQHVAARSECSTWCPP